MSGSLKQEIVSGVFWSSVERIGSLGIQFVITIIIARVLTPVDYGLIGMLTIFTALGAVLLDSGFGQALIRKNDTTETDYSTVFFTNLALGLTIYFILYFCAPVISIFFHTPELTKISRYVFLVFPINAIGLIQNTIITKNTNFKLLTKISIISAILSGIFGISLAYSGLGVWTLVYQSLFYNLIRSILLWFFNKWRPSLIFSFNSIKNLFGFSSNLLGTGVIVVLFNNIYTLLIGRFYLVEQVGFYNQANRFQDLPTQTLTAIIQRVSYPVLSKIQDDDLRLKSAYRKIINQTVFFNFPLMLGLIATGKNLFLILLTEKWLPAVPYFQLLCIYGALFPLHSINVNILKVKGKGKMLLNLEIIRRLIMVSVIFITLRYGIITLLIGNIVASLLSISINMYFCGKEISFRIFEQIKDITPYFLIALISSLTMFILNEFLEINVALLLSVQIITGILVYLVISQILKLQAYIEMRQIVLGKINSRIGN
jgi:teichuronic acid exporter